MFKCKKDFFSIILLLIIGVVLRYPAINPLALWNDDAWVSLIYKTYSLKSFLLVGSHSPILFSAMQFISAKIISDKEVAMQIIPFIFSVLQTVIFYFLIKELTKSKKIAFLAAFLLAVSPNLVDYSVRAKQYTFDSFASISIIFIYIRYLKDNYSLKKYILSLLVFFLFYLGSYTSIIISGILVHIFILQLVRMNKNRVYIVATAVFDLLVIFYYFFFVKKHINATIEIFWKANYISFENGVSSGVVDLLNKFAIFIVQPFIKIMTISGNNIGFVVVVFVLIIFGFKYLKNNYKDLLLFYVLFFITTFSMAILHKYPIASARSDIYSYPIIIALVSLGIYQIKNIFIKSDILWNILIIVICARSLALTNFATYKTSFNSKVCFEKIDNEIKVNDFLLVDTTGIYEYAFYTNKKISFEKDDSVTMGFLPVFENDYGVLPFRYIENYGYMHGGYEIFDKTKDYDRIFFYSSNFNPKIYSIVEEKMLNNSFVKFYSNTVDCVLVIYDKK